MAKREAIKQQSLIGAVVICSVLLVLCIAVFARYQHLKKQTQANAEIIEELEAKKAKEERRTMELQQQEAYQQTDAYVEEQARSLLNLIKPGDTAIKPQKDN